MKGMTAVLLLGMTAYLYAEDPLAENQMRIGRVSGDVQLYVQGAFQGAEAKTDMPIEPGDQLHTGEDGEVEIAVTSRALWVIQPNSDLIFGHTTEQEGRILMRRGALLGRVDASNNRPGLWRFETPLAVSTVKGTEFALAHSDEEGTHLGVLQGTVEFRQAETADSSTDSYLLIEANEAGVAKKKKPLSEGAWSADMRKRMRKLPEVRKRQRETANVWSPLTTGYRKELRVKLVPAAPKTPVRRALPPQRKKSSTSR